MFGLFPMTPSQHLQKKKNQNELPPIFPFRDKFVLEDGTEQNVPFVVRLQHLYFIKK